MPRRKSSTGRRKPSYKKARRVVGKANAAKRRKNMDTFATSMRVQALLVPQQGVTVSNYFYTTANLVNPSSTIGVTQTSEFQLYQQMYDQVRINSVRIKVTPKANMLTQAEAQNDSLLNNSGDGLVHTVIDRDSSGINPNIAAWKRYPSYRSYSVFKPFSRYYSITYPKGVWLDTDGPTSDTDLLKQLGATGGIFLYAENLLEDVGEILNEPFGTLEVVYSCVFRGRKMTTLTRDSETGAITIKAADIPTISPTPLFGIRGTIDSDTLASQVVVDGDGALEAVPITDATVPNV